LADAKEGIVAGDEVGVLVFHGFAPFTRRGIVPRSWQGESMDRAKLADT
jgi:hypothetical protein